MTSAAAELVRRRGDPDQVFSGLQCARCGWWLRHVHGTTCPICDSTTNTSPAGSERGSQVLPRPAETLPTCALPGCAGRGSSLVSRGGAVPFRPETRAEQGCPRGGEPRGLFQGLRLVPLRGKATCSPLVALGSNPRRSTTVRVGTCACRSVRNMTEPAWTSASARKSNLVQQSAPQRMKQPTAHPSGARRNGSAKVGTRDSRRDGISQPQHLGASTLLLPLFPWPRGKRAAARRGAANFSLRIPWALFRPFHLS